MDRPDSPVPGCRKPASSAHGFTMIELLVAVSVFAIMSVMAYGGLKNVIDNSASSEAALNRLQQVQHAVITVSRDLNQIIKRDIRDEYGNPNPYLYAGSDIDNIVEFTRGGRRNPAQLMRSNMLRVAYRQDENTLVRLTWPQLDRSPGIEPYESILLEGITRAELRFLDQDGEWHEQWPPLSNTAAFGSGAESLIAIEFTLELEDWGEITRLYKVSG